MEGPSGEAELPLLTVKHELRNGERAGPGVARGRRGRGGRAGENTAEQGAPTELVGTSREISVWGKKEDDMEDKGRSVYDGGGEGAFSYF